LNGYGQPCPSETVILASEAQEPTPGVPVPLVYSTFIALVAVI
jgi:hypothetical protein